MANKMKYIVTANENGDEEIFIFSKKIDHDCMAESLIGIKDQSWGIWERIYRYPISAGFTDGNECWGRSETLDLDSRGKKDSDLIKE